MKKGSTRKGPIQRAHTPTQEDQQEAQKNTKQVRAQWQTPG
jgi:hypothetical protein